MNNKECEDKIEEFDDELEELSVGSLKSLLTLALDCTDRTDCSSCGGQIRMLKELIAEKEYNLGG